jgi:23S rRNA-/tRNA-specific pseudouridylate synthase
MSSFAPAQPCIDISITGVPQIPILFEDDDILVVNKPSPMLSVPGKSTIPRLPRHIEWRNAINNAADNELIPMSPECRDSLRALSKRTAKADNVPRKQLPFENCVKKMLKIIDDPDLVHELWEVVNKSDDLQHKVVLADIPPHRVSVVEAAEDHCSKKVFAGSSGEKAPPPKIFAVHRLDCETSGVLFLAKTEEAAGDMGVQFRGRKVSIATHTKICVDILNYTVCVLYNGYYNIFPPSG